MTYHEMFNFYIQKGIFDKSCIILVFYTHLIDIKYNKKSGFNASSKCKIDSVKKT